MNARKYGPRVIGEITINAVEHNIIDILRMAMSIVM